FNYTKKLSYEELHPRFCKTAVTGWRSIFRVAKSLSCVRFAVIFVSVVLAVLKILEGKGF
ncbi:hypothetical protein, partial [Flavobacterium aurantiibacter]